MKIMYKATDKEIRARLKSFGGFSGEFQRVGDNVVIADGDVVVIIKLDPERSQTLYDISPSSFDDEFLFSHLENKTWATEEVIEDVRRAQKLINK